MENVTFSTVSTAGAYFVAGALVTTTAYKISQYMLFAGSEASRIKSAIVATGASFCSLPLITSRNVERISSVIGYGVGVHIVLTFIFTIILLEGLGFKSWIEIREFKSDFTSYGAPYYRLFLPKLTNKKMAFLQSESDLVFADFVDFYLREKRLNLHNLPLNYCNLQSFLRHGKEILSTCERSNAVLYIRRSDWLLDSTDLLTFYHFIQQFSVLVFICTTKDLIKNLPSNSDLINIPFLKSPKRINSCNTYPKATMSVRWKVKILI